jgi:hypothetical protein
MWHIESMYLGKPIYLNEANLWSRESQSVKLFESKEAAQAHMHSLPQFSRNAKGVDAEIVRHAHIAE